MISLFSLTQNSDSPHQLIDWHLRCLCQVCAWLRIDLFCISAVFHRLWVWRGGGVVGSEVCSRLKFLRVVSSVQRLFAQMVMWRKTGDRFAVGKKARPMGARLAHA